MPVEELKSKDVHWHELEPSQFIDVDDDVIAANMRVSHDDGPEHSMLSVVAVDKSRALCFNGDNKVQQTKGNPPQNEHTLASTTQHQKKGTGGDVHRDQNKNTRWERT